MDKGADRIAQDIKDIVQTRIAIAEKLGAIEQHVGSTMQHARTTMTQVADKTTSSVHETLKATKEAFDPRVHVARHPWVFVGGTLVLGYAVGALYRRGWRIDGVVPYYPRGAKGAAVMPTSGSPSSEQQESGVYPFYPHREADNASKEQGRSDRLTLWAELERVLQDELGVGTERLRPIRTWSPPRDAPSSRTGPRADNRRQPPRTGLSVRARLNASINFVSIPCRLLNSPSAGGLITAAIA